METTSVARRYAQALYSYAAEEKALDAVREDCLAIRQLIQSSQEFSDFVGNPTVPADVSDNALVAMFEGKSDAVTLRFLRFLGQRSRLAELDGVCNLLEQRICDDAGILNVTITAAHDLSADQVDGMKKKLGERYSKQIEATVAVDASLIGGFKIQVGDHIQDFSIATKLEQFEQGVIRA